jgi:hypothetical protein
MSKLVTNLSAEELESLAQEAWDSAAREALAKGLSVTGSRDGRRYRYHPDGRIEDLGPVARIEDLGPVAAEPGTSRKVKSVA